MTRPSQLAAARAAADRWPRVAAMAEVMREMEANHGACTWGNLRAAGFTDAEIKAYEDPARAVLSGRPHLLPPEISGARAEAEALTLQARLQRAPADAFAPCPITHAGMRRHLAHGMLA